MIPWHIAFTDQHMRPRGLQRWLKPGYRHCLAYQEQEDGRWLMVNAFPSRLYIACWEVPPEYRENVTATAIIGPVEPVGHPTGHVLAYWSPYPCVAICKRLLGIREWLVWTPWQLYMYLQEHRI